VKERVLWVSDSERCRFRSRLADETLTDFSRPLFLVTMEVLPAHPGVDEDVMRRGLHLTKREAEIVSYIFRGHRNAEIADRLFISEGTVKNHLRSIYEKAQVKNRTGLIHKVLTLGQPGLRASRTLRERL
jgi:DNA-binding CsgD family transcriptional regulator